MIKRIALIVFVMILSTNIYATDNITEDIAESFDIDNYLKIFEDYNTENNIEGFNVKELYSELINGQGINYSNVLDIIANNILKQFKDTFSSVISIFIVIVITAIVKSLELDSGSDVVKITKLIILISVCTILLKNYLDIISMFKDIVNLLGYAMQVVSTFLLGILIATGKITSTGIIEPLLLFISNFICFITEYIIIPFFTVSIAINIVSRISENIKMDTLSSMFRKSSLYIFTTAIGIFLFVLSMETTITKSIDNVYFQTAQTAVSNMVPVVGKFLSDSLDTVLGATQLIGKVGGIVALISTTILVSIPVFKLLSVVILYNLLIAISEPINEDKDIESLLKGFVGIYKDMLGILIGVMVLFVMSVGIILNLVSSVTV
ncbi:MAG: stage III sporulation protein AE [Clostridia bacterium]|nr:stage III sporulation protein AE [Clostridia bacterium]